MGRPAIRPARPGDLEGLLDLWEALTANGSQADARYRATPDARARMAGVVADVWLQREPFAHCLVAEDGGLVGYVTGWPLVRVPVVELEPTVRFGDLYVDEAHRRGGIGRALVGELLRVARHAGFPRAEVGTLTADARAVAFWRAMGFGDWQVLLARDPEAGRLG